MRICFSSSSGDCSPRLGSLSLTQRTRRGLRSLLPAFLLFAAPLSAQIANHDAFVRGIESAHAGSAADLDARIGRIQSTDHNTEIFLCFARLRNSVAARNTAAVAPDLHRILAAADALGDEATLRVVYSELAETLSHADSIGPLIEERNHALQQAQRAPRFPQFQIFSSLGEAFLRFYDDTDADAAYDLAGQHLSGQTDQLAATYYTRHAAVLARVGRLDSALDSFRRARDIYRRIGHMPAQLLVDNAELERHLGHYDAAQDFINQARQIVSPSDSLRTRFGVEETLARILIVRKQYDPALECIRRAEALAPRDDFMLQHLTFALYHDLYYESHNYPALLGNARAMLASAQSSGNQRAINYARGLLGLALGLNGEVEKGIQLIEEAERINLRNHSGNLGNLEQKYLVYEAAHRYAEALRAYHEYNDAQQRWSERTNQQNLARLESYLALQKSEENGRYLQLQLDYLTRRSQLKGTLAVLLLVCLLLAVALAWSLWRVNLARKQQALEDPLTGLRNRRFLSPFMEHETERLSRSGLTALIVIADVDLFKNVNDRWGHEVGDAALVQLAEMLRHCVRNSDVISRWGGEEFVIICPESTEPHAPVICDRIRHHLQQTPVRAQGAEPFHLTLSIGAALFSPGVQDEHWESALARADRALYFVKNNGRDGWSLAASASALSTSPDPAPI